MLKKWELRYTINVTADDLFNIKYIKSDSVCIQFVESKMFRIHIHIVGIFYFCYFFRGHYWRRSAPEPQRKVGCNCAGKPFVTAYGTLYCKEDFLHNQSTNGTYAIFRIQFPVPYFFLSPA
jgi:hypothetical protein